MDVETRRSSVSEDVPDVVASESTSSTQDSDASTDTADDASSKDVARSAETAEGGSAKKAEAGACSLGSSFELLITALKNAFAR